MKPIIIYCYDAYCVWCFGFGPVIKKIWSEFSCSFDFEVWSGGMILPQKPVHINATASYFLETYKKVEVVTGVIFGEDYLWHINNPFESYWYPNSEKPAIALCILKDYFPGKQVEFATDLQHALHVEGRDLCDDEAYRHLLHQYNIPERAFYEKLRSEAHKEQAYYEFELVKHFKITGFPFLLIQLSESKFFMLTNGYSDYDTLVQRMKSVIKENNLQNIN